MPIYEYVCRACGTEFEAFLRGGEKAVCPGCKGADLDRLLSTPGSVKTGAVSDKAMRAAKARDKRVGRERVEEQRLYELNHPPE